MVRTTTDPKKHTVCVRLTEGEWQALQAIAAVRRMSKSDALRSLLDPAVKRLVRDVARTR